MKWQTAKLRSLPVQIVDGDRSSRYPKRDELQPEGVLFLNTTNIENNKLELTNANYISIEKFEQIRKGRLQRRDIVMTTRGSIGKLAFFDCQHETGIINAQMIILRADDTTIDAQFLFYLMCSSHVQALIKNFASGSAQPQIPIQDLREIQIAYPPIDIQRSISAILSNYDDLIENNTRRIRLLEQAARDLYYEWFVDFRFPGHEQSEMVESESGLIPEKWTICRLGDVLELRYGKSLTETKRLGGTVPVYGSSGVVGYHNESIVNTSGIIVGRKGNVGSIFWSQRPFYAIDTVFYVATDLNLYFVYHNLKGRNFLNSDAAVPGLNRNYALSLPVVVPPADLVNKYGEIVSPIFESIHNLQVRNQLLQDARDLLLPRLISGVLDIKQLSMNSPIAEEA